MGDVFTLEDCQRAVEKLRALNVPTPDGYYVAFLHHRQLANFKLTVRDWSTYRERDLAFALLRHEWRREDLGKRGVVTAEEIVDRVRKLVDQSAS